MFTGRYRWFVFGFITVLMLINFLDRVVMSFAIVPIAKTFHLNPGEMGLLLSAFFWGLVPASLVAGYLADHWGPKRVWSLGAIWWSLFTMVTGLMTSFAGFLSARVLFGIGEGPTLSNGIRVVTSWASPKERGQALGLVFVGVFLGPAIGAPIVTALMLHFGWRSPFYVLGVAGLLWVVAWQYVFHDRPQDSRHVTPHELDAIRARATLSDAASGSFRDVRTTVFADIWTGFCFGYALYFLLTWLPSYLVIERHLSLRALGFLAGIPWIGAVLGQYLGGVLSDVIYRRTGNWRWSRSYLIAGFLLIVGLSLYAGMAVTSVTAAMTFLTVATTANAFAGPIIDATLIDQVPQRSGTWGGVLQVAFTVPGIIAPIITGILVAVTHSFVMPFTIASLVLVSGAIVAATLIRPAVRATNVEHVEQV